MNQQEILEYNKRCAEFLGMYDYSKDNEYFEKGTCYTYPEKDKNPGSGYYTILQKTTNGYTGIFNSDWNWIKLVLEKISSLNEDDFSSKTQHAFEDLLDLSLFSSKESVCESINNFIKTIK